MAGTSRRVRRSKETHKTSPVRGHQLMQYASPLSGRRGQGRSTTIYNGWRSACQSIALRFAKTPCTMQIACRTAKSPIKLPPLRDNRLPGFVLDTVEINDQLIAPAILIWERCSRDEQHFGKFQTHLLTALPYRFCAATGKAHMLHAFHIVVFVAHFIRHLRWGFS